MRRTAVWVAVWVAAVVGAAGCGKSSAPGDPTVLRAEALKALKDLHARVEPDEPTHDQSVTEIDLSRSELSIAAYLQTQNPDTTVILHDDPTAPSLLAIVSERRVVLGWGRPYYAIGSEARVREVDRLFRSASGKPDEAIETLRRYSVTHVVVRADRDRVSPALLARLTPVMTFPDAALYAVPDETPTPR